MNFRWNLLTIASGIFIFASFALVGESAAAADKTTTPPARVLSTEMSGVDSLDVLPDEMITRSGSGTRRVKLQNSVFRREEPYVYQSTGRRDPFRALIVNEKKEGEIKTDLLRLEGAVLTGIVWSSGDFVAMVKDKDAKSFFLRKGDRIYKGRVIEVKQSKVILEVIEFGDYRRVTLKVQG
jgi:hypothetical protein